MAGIWEFLSSEANREVLAWIGGGIATVVSAVWIASKGFFAKPKPSGEVRVVEVARVPKGAWALGLVGLALLGFAISKAGDTCVVNGNNSGDITGSSVTVQGGDAEVDC